MEIKELKDALKSGIPVIWRGKHDYESTIGRLTGIILRAGASGEDEFSCEITSSSSLSGRSSVVICRPEELSLWNPMKIEQQL